MFAFMTISSMKEKSRTIFKDCEYGSQHLAVATQIPQSDPKVSSYSLSPPLLVLPLRLQPHSLNTAKTMTSAANSYYELYRGSRYSPATTLATTEALTAVLTQHRHVTH